MLYVNHTLHTIKKEGFVPFKLDMSAILSNKEFCEGIASLLSNRCHNQINPVHADKRQQILSTFFNVMSQLQHRIGEVPFSNDEIVDFLEPELKIKMLNIKKVLPQEYSLILSIVPSAIKLIEKIAASPFNGQGNIKTDEVLLISAKKLSLKKESKRKEKEYYTELPLLILLQYLIYAQLKLDGSCGKVLIVPENML